MCLAIPGKIISIENDEPIYRSGRVSFGGIIKEVNLACVPEAQIGDYVIVHVGFAINKLDEAEAVRVFQYLQEIDDLGELESQRILPDPPLEKEGDQVPLCETVEKVGTRL
jgi:hydrogenase expression/formation protein HypC